MVRVRELSVLGPVEVGVPPLARRCLAALALLAPSSVRVGELLEIVWGDEPPATAQKSLQNAVVAIRRVLGSDAVEHLDGAYRLTLPTDRERFESLVRSNAAAEALGLWRGEPWQDLDHPRAIADATRLRRLLERAEEDAVAHHLDVAAAERIVASDSLSERRWMLLMRALYREGRQAEALRAASRARAALAEVGLVPGPAFEELERAVATHDPVLGPRRMAGSVLEVDARTNGAEALRQQRFSDALRWLRLAGDDSAALVDLGRAQLGAGDPASARATLLAAIASAERDNEHSVAGDAALALAATVFTSADDAVTTTIDRVLQRCASATAPPEALARARAASALATARVFTESSPAAEARCEEALRDAVAVNDDIALCAALKGATYAAGRPQGAGRQIELARELAAVAERTEDEEGAAIALCVRRQAQLQMGSASHFDTLSEVREMAATARHAAARSYCEIWSAGMPLLTGDVAEAEREAAELSGAMAGYVADTSLIHAIYPSYLFTIRWMQGRLDELLPVIEMAADSMPELPTWRSALAMTRAAAGDSEGSSSLAEGLLSKPLNELVAPTLWAATTWHLANAVTALKAPDLAEKLLLEIEPVVSRHATYSSIYLGSYAHHAGTLQAVAGRREEATRLLEMAVGAHRGVGATWWEQLSASALSQEMRSSGR